MSTPINISASRGAAILGLSSYTTAVHVWLEIMEKLEPGFCAKNNYALPEFEEKPAMRWGHAFESAIIELAEQKYVPENQYYEKYNFNPCKIVDRELLCGYNYLKSKIENLEIAQKENLAISDDIFITCHIDGVYADLRALHEGKTTSEFYFRDHFGEPETDAVPVEYQIQCQHQMICTGADKVILSVLVFPKRVEEFENEGIIALHPESTDKMQLVKIDKNGEFVCRFGAERWAYPLSQMGYFHQYIITPNIELQQLMIKHYSEFWEKNVVGRTPPEPRTYDDIRAICREPVGTIIADEQIERLAAEYKNITEEISATGSLGKRKDQLKIMICDYMRTAAKIEDEDSRDKFILRDATGKKIATYGKNKAGQYYFR